MSRNGGPTGARRAPDASPLGRLIPTARGAGALAAFVVLAAVALATGSPGPVALLVALGVVILAAPPLAWARGSRALAGRSVRVALHALPPTVPVGDDCVLQIDMAVPGGPTGPGDSGTRGRRRTGRLPPLGLERPGDHWDRSGRRPDPADPPAATFPPPSATWPGSPGRRRRPDPTPAARGRHWLAPGPGALLPLAAARGTATPAAPASGPGQAPGPAVPATGVTVPVPTGRRGVLHLPPLRAWVHDPLGLFAVPVARTRPLAVVVHPRPGALPPATPASAARPADGAAEAPGPGRPWEPDGTGDFADLRPYVAGDRLHLLDWPALARYDLALVRRFGPEMPDAVRILLDDRAGVHRRAGFEALLSALLELVDRALASGRPVEITTLSGLRCAVPPGPAGLAPCLPFAATLLPRRPAGGDPPGNDGPPATVLTTGTGVGRLPPALRRDAVVVAG